MVFVSCKPLKTSEVFYFNKPPNYIVGTIKSDQSKDTKLWEKKCFFSQIFRGTGTNWGFFSGTHVAAVLDNNFLFKAYDRRVIASKLSFNGL